MPRSIEVLQNDRNFVSDCYICLHKEIDASRFSGPEQFSSGAALILLLSAKMIFRRRFDRFRCLDRGAQKRSNKRSIENQTRFSTVTFLDVLLRTMLLQCFSPSFFSPPLFSSSPRYFSRDKFGCALKTREKLVSQALIAY